MKKPLRVWSADREKRYGIVVSNYDELIQKACQKLAISSEGTRFALEEDGTHIDESFFETLKDHTRLIVLGKDEEWQAACQWPPQKGQLNIDLVDGITDEKELAEKLFLEMQKNPAIMVFLNLSDMEVIKDANLDEINSKLLNKECARQLQEQCINLYITKKREDDALQLIDLIKDNKKCE